MPECNRFSLKPKPMQRHCCTLLLPAGLTIVTLCFLVSLRRFYLNYNCFKTQPHVCWLRREREHTLHQLKVSAQATCLLHNWFWDPFIDLLVGPVYRICFYPMNPLETLRSSGSGLLIIPKIRTKTHGEASFLLLWSTALEQPSWRPVDSREMLTFLKSKLRTSLFSLANWILCISFIYLSIYHTF